MLTSTQAAAELGISARRVLALIAAGRLRAKLFGKAWMIHPRALDAVRTRIPGRPLTSPRRRCRLGSL